MDHDYVLRNDLPEAGALAKVLELLLAFVAVDSVYFSPHLDEGPNAGVVVVVLLEGSPLYWDEVHRSCERLFDGFPQFSFRVFDREWIGDELKDGNLFFVSHCNRQAQLYAVSGSGVVALLDGLKKKRFMKNAKGRFRVDEEVVFAVGLDLRYYLRGGNLLQAAYTLHQSMRWLFIAASRFLTGEWLVADHLGVQQRHIAGYSVVLGGVFDEHLAEDAVLLEVLDAARKAVQVQAAPPVLTLELLRLLEMRRDTMRAEVRRLFAACMERCCQQFTLRKQPLLLLDTADPLQLITSIVTETVDVLALYCIGERTVERQVWHPVLDGTPAALSHTHYYLLLFVGHFVADAPGNLADRVRTRTNGRCTVTVLMHGKKSLGTSNSDQQFFFHRAMEQGRLLFQAARPPYLGFSTPPARNMERARAYVEQRRRAVDSFVTAVSQDMGTATRMKVYLLHLIVEHTCLGLIRLFLGYTPNHFSLPFLFELCTYFCQLTTLPFQRETDQDKRLYRLLVTSCHTLRHGVVDDVDPYDYELLRRLCLEFAAKGELEGSKVQGLGFKD